MRCGSRSRLLSGVPTSARCACAVAAVIGAVIAVTGTVTAVIGAVISVNMNITTSCVAAGAAVTAVTAATAVTAMTAVTAVRHVPPVRPYHSVNTAEISHSHRHTPQPRLTARSKRLPLSTKLSSRSHGRGPVLTLRTPPSLVRLALR